MAHLTRWRIPPLERRLCDACHRTACPTSCASAPCADARLLRNGAPGSVRSCANPYRLTGVISIVPTPVNSCYIILFTCVRCLLQATRSVKTIAFISQKGGVGKSTFTVHMGVAAAHAGRKIVIVDSDPQEPAALSHRGTRSPGSTCSNRPGQRPGTGTQRHPS
jgi:Mrp family chromosome partitioning ATPase